MELKQKIVKEMVRRKMSFVPMTYCPDGHYTDYDEWDAVEVDDKYYDINFYSDGDTFYITAYMVNGTYERDNTDFFHIFTYPLKEKQHDTV